MRLKWIERGKLKKKTEKDFEGGLPRVEVVGGGVEEESGEVMRPVTGFTPRLCGN